MRAQILAFGLLALLAFAFADISVTSYSVLPATIKPGITGSVSITILNSGANATSVTAEPQGSEFINAGGTISVGDFSSGITTSFTVPFSVAEGTPAGIYNLPVRISYYSSGSAGFTTGTKSVTIPITVKNPATLQLDAGTGASYSDVNFLVSGTIRNSGGVAYEAKLSPNSTKFYPIGPTPLLLGTIENSTPFSLNLSIAPGTASGRYTIPLVISYRDVLGTEYSETLNLNAEVKVRSPDFSLSISSSEGSKVNPGKKTTLLAILSNTGDMEAREVSVKLLSPELLTPLSSSEFSAGNIAPGSEALLTFDAGVKDVEPGFYPIEVEITYKNSQGEAQPAQKISAGVDVVALNELSIFVSSKPSPITSGGVHTFSVLVSNIGSSRIKALQVEPAQNDVFRILEAQPSQFIGGLEQDDFSSVQYKVLVGNVQEGTYPFQVRASFKDAYNVGHEYNSTAMLEVVSPATAQLASGQAQGGLEICLGAFLFIAILVGIYYFHFWKKGKNPLDLLPFMKKKG